VKSRYPARDPYPKVLAAVVTQIPCKEGVALLFLVEVPQSWASDGPKALGNTQTPISHFHSDPPERTSL
jgi:hypothetical protein